MKNPLWLALVVALMGCGDVGVAGEEIRFRLVNYNYKTVWIEIPELGTGRVYAGEQTELLSAELPDGDVVVNMRICADDRCSTDQARSFKETITLGRMLLGPGLIVARQTSTIYLCSFDVLIDQVDRDQWCKQRSGDQDYSNYAICE